MNDYEKLARNYSGSDVKPDKKFSILPTVMRMIGDCRGKTVIDIGCGSGFFTKPFAEAGAWRVTGVDNLSAQISLARKFSSHSAITYVVGDVFKQCGGPVDVINTPFVLNYARTTHILKHFLELIFESLNEGGRVAFVIDLPNGKNLKKFGAIKTFLNSQDDESQIKIDLFNGERKICTLTSIYYTPATIERLLNLVGFKNICWHQAIVSEDGLKEFPPDFWRGYTNDCELGYLTAEK